MLESCRDRHFALVGGIRSQGRLLIAAVDRLPEPPPLVASTVGEPEVTRQGGVDQIADRRAPGSDFRANRIAAALARSIRARSLFATVRDRWVTLTRSCLLERWNRKNRRRISQDAEAAEAASGGNSNRRPAAIIGPDSDAFRASTRSSRRRSGVVGAAGQVQWHQRPRTALQAPSRDRSRCSRSPCSASSRRSSASEHSEPGVRSQFTTAGLRGRIEHADRRSQRRRGRMGGAVPGGRSVQVPVQGAQRSDRYLSRPERSGHAEGRR